MVTRKELLTYLNKLLTPQNFEDYMPNGLQIEGKDQIQKIITGVSMNQPLVNSAVKENADALLTHHGCFWNGESYPIVGIKKKRFQPLLQNDINLIVYHLPLDAHPIYGNNVQLSKMLEIEVDKSFAQNDVTSLIWVGHLKEPMPARQFCEKIEKVLNRKPLCISPNDRPIHSIAWCSGGGKSYMDYVTTLNVDAYLTGEISEDIVHVARENDMHLIAAGHHATERYGIKALGEHLAEKFNLEHQFIDIDNPI